MTATERRDPAASLPRDHPAALAGTAAAGDALLQARLVTIDGYDVIVGLRCVGNQWPVLRRALRQFVDMYDAPPASDFDAGLDAAALDARAAQAHTLRGVCGTVGALGLQDNLRAHEGSLRALAERARGGQTLSAVEVDVLAGEAASLRKELLSLVRALRQALDEASRPPG